MDFSRKLRNNYLNTYENTEGTDYLRKRNIAVICGIGVLLVLAIPRPDTIKTDMATVTYKTLEHPKIESTYEKYKKYIDYRNERDEYLLKQEKIKLIEEEAKRISDIEKAKEQENKLKEDIKLKTKAKNEGNKSKSRNLQGREAIFNLTFYDACYSCTQNSSNPGLTASGKYAKQGITVAAPKDIAFGTNIKIGNNTYEVQDRGEAIVNSNGMIHLDVYVNTHEQALKLGRKIVKGHILN